MSNRYFGRRWPSEALRNAVPVPVPVGAVCLWCDELVDEDDSGIFTVAFTEGGHRERVAHMECQLRSLMGDIYHLTRRCSCFGGEGHDQRPYRQGARDVIEYLRQRPFHP